MKTPRNEGGRERGKRGHRSGEQLKIQSQPENGQEKNAFRYKQNGRRRVPREELKQHFDSEYALFKVVHHLLAGVGWNAAQ